jgi:hypothetical protein
VTIDTRLYVLRGMSYLGLPTSISLNFSFQVVSELF